MEAYLEMVSEKNKLDPVDDKANDKKFKDRKDKDIDNDGDVDSSDEYLHKRRAATDDAIDGGKKPAKNAVKKEEDEEEGEDKKKKPFPPKKNGDEEESEAEKDEKESDPVDADGEDEKPEDPKKKDKNPRTADKTAEISKIGEKKHGKVKKESYMGVDLSDATAELLHAIDAMFEAKAAQAKGATPPEGIDDKASPSEKKFKDLHKVDVKKHDDMEKVMPPKDVKVKKEMTEFEVIRAILSGKTPE